MALSSRRSVFEQRFGQGAAGTLKDVGVVSNWQRAAVSHLGSFPRFGASSSAAIIFAASTTSGKRETSGAADLEALLP